MTLLTNDPSGDLGRLIGQLSTMRVHRRNGRPSPYKPFVLLLNIRRIMIDPSAERLIPYDVIARDFGTLIEKVGCGTSSAGREAFRRLGSEPFWELESKGETRGGFTDLVQSLMTDPDNATTVRTLVVEQWIEPEFRAAVIAATLPP